MDEDQTTRDLVQRIRRGDAEAAGELWRAYEPEIRLEVQLRLRGNWLCKVLESKDICQSVFGSFFVRLKLGCYDVQTPEELIHLLMHLVRNKMVDQVRLHSADRRDRRRTVRLGETDIRFYRQASGLTPADEVALKDLHQLALNRLNPVEHHIAEQRAGGASWEKIAKGLQLSPNAVRKRLKRAVDRLAGELE